MTSVIDRPTFSNPILNADWPDPDVVEVDGVYYLVASSFNRSPGLPILRSVNLVDWEPAGHALSGLVPRDHFSAVRRGGGVWAPSIRHHAGRFWIFYPDPDFGIYVIQSQAAEGPWSEPHLLLAGKGIIDPCPLWDEDGSAYLVHGWAASRSGVKNRLSVRQMSSNALSIVDAGDVIVIDGADLPGYTTLEGPKFYRHDGYYWIFAPAGGVSTGWQSAFRATSPYGPYEARIVLAQGDSPVNGPHQGAWVRTPAGEDWFLHFQDRGPYGRVVHLQPMTWTHDGWPIMGRPVNGQSYGIPVTSHPYPRGTEPSLSAPPSSDDFAQLGLGPQWHWQANPEPGWITANGEGSIVLHAQSTDTRDLRAIPNVLSQILPGVPTKVTTTLDASAALSGTFAGLAILGRSYGWLGLERTETGYVLRGGTEDHELCHEALDGPELELMVTTRANDRGVFSWRAAHLDEWRHSEWDFPLVQGQWIGAEIALFAATTDHSGIASDVIVGQVCVDSASTMITSESRASGERPTVKSGSRI